MLSAPRFGTLFPQIIGSSILESDGHTIRTKLTNNLART